MSATGPCSYFLPMQTESSTSIDFFKKKSTSNDPFIPLMFMFTNPGSFAGKSKLS